jgi:hypothetical protein
MPGYINELSDGYLHKNEAAYKTMGFLTFSQYQIFSSHTSVLFISAIET